MDVIYRRCCGLDVHKKSITACVLIVEDGRRSKHLKRFGTMTADLRVLADWLRSFQATDIAMESTGVYWKPVWNILGEHFQLHLVNAQHIKNVPGRKTDMKDCEWIAQLLQHGLLRGSFVPNQTIRELRDLNRYRVSLIGERSRAANRIQKILEDANIKLASVASDTLGVSGRRMLEAIIGGEHDAETLSDLARGLLRKKLPELRLALDGRVTEHHRFCLRQLLDHLDFLNKKIDEIEKQIGHRSRAFDEAIRLWDTIPGIDQVTACCLVAEIGAQMEQFPSAAHLASWAGLCPGNDESAGKRRSGKTRKGNPWLRRVLVQAAWAASHVKKGYLSAQFRRIAARRGRNRALIAVAHKLLIIIYHVLQRRQQYRDLGADYFDSLNSEGLKRTLVRRLERLGHTVILKPAEELI
jgi:transposase